MDMEKLHTAEYKSAYEYVVQPRWKMLHCLLYPVNITLGLYQLTTTNLWCPW